MRNFTIIFLLALTIAAFTEANSEETRLLRYPNTSKTQVTFCYGGDIYVAPIEGGLARRITVSDGFEIFPRFSPDGKTIAFSGEHDGNREVYIVPSEGGQPERLTYLMDIGKLPSRMGPDRIIMQWTKDGENILYRSRHESWNAWVGQLFSISKDGGMPEQIPVPRGGFAYMFDGGKKMVYNRTFREFRTWKRYRGGQADDIWIYDFETKELENITENPAQDIIPMFRDGKIYYLSDREHFMNLYVYDIKTKETRRLTNFDKYDIKFPSLGAEHIAFENGGYIYLMDLATEKTEKLNIEIAEDFPWVRKSIENVKDKITSWNIAPDGKRAVFCARGDIYTVPEKKGRIYNLTETPAVHDRHPVWSPDGERIAFISDKDGENEIYKMKPDGSELTQLTDSSKSYLWKLIWSPDSKKIMFSDKTMRLYYLDVESGEANEVTKSEIWEIRNFDWSPDGEWIVYTDFINNYLPRVNLYSLENEESYQVTSEFFNSSGGVFSPDGKYLYFLSDRTYKPKYNAVEWNFFYEDMTKIYGVTLQDMLESPFAFEEDKVGESEKKSVKEKKADEEEDASIQIDIEGIKDRVFELPVKADKYSHLSVVQDGDLYYSRNGKFWRFDLDEKEEKKVGDFSNFEISHDGNKILYSKKKKYYIAKLGSKIQDGKGKLNLGDMKTEICRSKEWKQIFDESWRQMRDFFYDPNMHGVDWKAVKAKYEELLPYVVHREDLTYIIGEMIGELNCGHSYVGGGDMPKVESVGLGLLGCEFELDEESGYYKITKIFEGRNWDEKTRSPLTEPGVDINEGEYLISIDGEKLTKGLHPYKALVGKVREYVRLEVNDEPNEDGAKEYDVKTIKSEAKLRYYNWVERNRKKVEEATNGRVGYVHIPNMMQDGLNEFVKYFYPQVRKEALIVDDRYNGGGNVSPMIIERLRRILLVAKNARNQEKVFTNPSAVMTGPIVCLLNQYSASDGDLFPYQFKEAEIGTLIGKRSWGGVIGIRGSLPFLDGGYLYKPEFANFGADGEWILEGKGMEPDIVVDNHPAKEYQGVDQQLNKAIEVILEKIKTNDKPKIPEVPSYPDKSE